jgi:hypothetical protein
VLFKVCQLSNIISEWRSISEKCLSLTTYCIVFYTELVELIYEAASPNFFPPSSFRVEHHLSQEGMRVSRVSGDNKGKKVGKDCEKRKDVMGAGVEPATYWCRDKGFG